MRRPSLLLRLSWIPVLCAAVGAVLWCDLRRIERIDFVSGLGAEQAVVDRASPTGYASGRRWLIAPEHANDTYRWISTTQQMLASGQPRIRETRDDNAPGTRPVRQASPYRWWLAAVAGAHQLLTHAPAGVAVERAALYGPMLLHVLLLAGLAAWTARRFGAAAAAIVTLASAALFPWWAAFLPGVLTDQSLAALCVVGSLLPLLGAFARSSAIPSSDSVAGSTVSGGSWTSFVLAGIAGGLGCWAEVRDQVPVLLGIALGATLLPWLNRGAAASPRWPWRLWGLSGATTVLVAYLLEFAPHHLDFRLDANHPLYALGWLLAGELAGLSQRWSDAPHERPAVRWLVLLAGSVVLAAGTAWAASSVWFAPVASSMQRMAQLPGAAFASSLLDWLRQSPPLVITAVVAVPVIALGFAGWLAFCRAVSPGLRGALLLGVTASLPALALAWVHLRAWVIVDAVVLCLLPAATLALSGLTRPAKAAAIAVALALLLPGGLYLARTVPEPRKAEFTAAEAEGLIERDLAHWLAARSDPASVIVLAPPFRTTALGFHGGFRSVGSLDPDNEAGLAAAVRLSRESSPDAVLALLSERQITHLVLPAWDRTLEDFAHAGGAPGTTLIEALGRWMLPRWLRPIAYQPPTIGGFEDRSVVIFEVVDEQDAAGALSRTVEYFVDMEQWDAAEAAADNLRQYSTNLGAMAALGQLAAARQDSARLQATLATLTPIVRSGYDRGLAWDRRVSLAIVLAQAGATDLARAQLQRCVKEADALRLRQLSTSALFRLLHFSNKLGVAFPDSALREQALAMLPAEARQRLESAAPAH